MKLSVDAQQLISQARPLDEPTLDDRDRIRARLDTSWASSPAAGTGASRLGAKIWLTTVSIVALVGVGLWLSAGPASAPAPLPVQTAAPVSSAIELPPTAAPALDAPMAQETPSVPTPVSRQPVHARARLARASKAAASATPAPRVSPIAPQPELENSAVVPRRSLQRQDVATPRMKASASEATARAVSERPEQFAPDAIADEVSLLGAAQTALHAGQPTRALGYIRQHSFRFPEGALAQERAAVHALALCAMNRKSAARQVFDDLARRAPSAAVLTRIKHDCGF